MNDDVVVHLVKEKQQHWQNVFFRILAHADLKLKMEDQTAKKISQCFDMCAFDSFGEKFKIQRATIHNMMKPANLKSRDSRLQGKRGAKYTFYTPICNTTLATSLEFEKLKSRVEKYALSKHTLTNSPERLCAL